LAGDHGSGAIHEDQLRFGGATVDTNLERLRLSRIHAIDQ
jgi:hypothetical protein